MTVQHVWHTPDEPAEVPHDFVCDHATKWVAPGPDGTRVVYHVNWRLRGFHYVCVACGERSGGK